MRPPSITKSGQHRVFRRCAMVTRGLSSCQFRYCLHKQIARFPGQPKARSLVKMTIGASFMMARAMDTLWRSPPEGLPHLPQARVVARKFHNEIMATCTILLHGDDLFLCRPSGRPKMLFSTVSLNGSSGAPSICLQAGFPPFPRSYRRPT